MKLYFANTSPYARKVRIVIIEKELDDQVELIFRNPFEGDVDLKTTNPLGKVPALLMSDGQALYDSSVICAYLDTLDDRNRLIPEETSKRWTVLRNAALADGILDAAFAVVMERRRPEEQQSSMWLDRWLEAILRSISSANADLVEFTGDISLAQIGLGSALGYLDFRLPDIDWRTEHPAISGWFTDFAKRSSMHQTNPEP